jgi:hypothetical protein
MAAHSTQVGSVAASLVQMALQAVLSDVLCGRVDVRAKTPPPPPHRETRSGLRTRVMQ